MKKIHKIQKIDLACQSHLSITLEFIGIFINQLWNFPGGTWSVIVSNVPSWIRDATLF